MLRMIIVKNRFCIDPGFSFYKNNLVPANNILSDLKETFFINGQLILCLSLKINLIAILVINMVFKEAV